MLWTSRCEQVAHTPSCPPFPSLCPPSFLRRGSFFFFKRGIGEQGGLMMMMMESFQVRKRMLFFSFSIFSFWLASTARKYGLKQFR